MHIIKVGLTYQTAPIEIREKLVFSDDHIEKAMIELNNQKSILENVILSTCNRMEIYVVADQLHTGRYYVKKFLADWFELEIDTFSKYMEILDNDHAVEHLFRVSTGLKSMVLGETQILGQIRQAFLTAQKINTTGTLFNELFKQAIAFAKRAHRETAINDQAVSVSYAAVELAKKIFGDINQKQVVILGAGEMGEQTARNLAGAGTNEIIVVNRTLERAHELANKFHAKAAKMTELERIMKNADILISSTGSSAHVLTKEDLISVQKERKGEPLFLVDIAVPRDLDPKIGELDSVFLYDIDDLQHIVDANLEARKAAAEEIELMLEAEIVAFNEWITTLGVVPVITALREKALAIQGTTLDSIIRKIPDLDERERKVLNKHTKSIINQLLKDPIRQAKELGAKENPIDSLSLFIDIFGLDESVKTEVAEQIVKSNSLRKTSKSKKVSFPIIDKLMTN